MTRKQLEDLGLTKEQVDSVMKINGDDIENAKGKKSINDVPDKIRDEVKQVLIDEGHPELAEGGN